MAGTEDASVRYGSVEDWPAADLVTGIIESQMAGVAAVLPAAAALARAVDEAVARLTEGGRLIYAGAGTSGRIATLDASELPPTFSWPYERAISIMAGGERALVRAVEGAEDDTDLARSELAALNLGRNDVVIALASSGRTPFAVAALDYARETGALAIGIYNNKGGKLGESSDIPVLIDTGAEFLAGSTRMKAGTAQKVALNCFSTAVMIRLGFVYRGLMVEMQPTNTKLKLRAAKMVAELADCDVEVAAKTLEEARGSIKVATVMLLKVLPLADAEALLAKGKGNLGGGARLMRFDLTDAPAPTDLDALSSHLGAYNDGDVGPMNRRPLAVFVRGDDGAMLAGLSGYTGWNWLFTQWLWVSADLRGQGMAGRMLEMAEAEAVARGCHHAWIDTFNPVALKAYERAGYAVFGELPEFIPGRARSFLQKPLAGA